MKAFARVVLCGVAGGVAWSAAMRLIFWPMQPILGDPERQSQKFLRVFGAIEPLPRMVRTDEPGTGLWVAYAIFLTAGSCCGLAYCLLRSRWWVGAGSEPRSSTAATAGRGLVFGLASWLVMVPWFEGYLPWNVMREPAGLVALEMACWLGVLLIVGQAVAWTDRGMRGRNG